MQPRLWQMSKNMTDLEKFAAAASIVSAVISQRRRRWKLRWCNRRWGFDFGFIYVKWVAEKLKVWYTISWESKKQVLKISFQWMKENLLHFRTNYQDEYQYAKKFFSLTHILHDPLPCLFIVKQWWFIVVKAFFFAINLS